MTPDDFENGPGIKKGTVVIHASKPGLAVKHNGAGGVAYTPSRPRQLAHELAHACREIQGGSTVCVSDQIFKDPPFGDLDERAAIEDWENVIGREMAADARTRANADGVDIETGTARIDHELAK